MWERYMDWLPLARLQLRTWPATQACVLTGKRTGDHSVWRPALNPLSHTSQGSDILFLFLALMSWNFSFIYLWLKYLFSAYEKSLLLLILLILDPHHHHTHFNISEAGCVLQTIFNVRSQLLLAKQQLRHSCRHLPTPRPGYYSRWHDWKCTSPCYFI